MTLTPELEDLMRASAESVGVMEGLAKGFASKSVAPGLVEMCMKTSFKLKHAMDGMYAALKADVVIDHARARRAT